MKFDYEAELPTRHHRVYPSRAMTDIQKEGTAANPLSTARRRRAVVREDRCILILDFQSRLHRDKHGGGHPIAFLVIGLNPEVIIYESFPAGFSFLKSQKAGKKIRKKGRF